MYNTYSEQNILVATKHYGSYVSGLHICLVNVLEE